MAILTPSVLGIETGSVITNAFQWMANIQRGCSIVIQLVVVLNVWNKSHLLVTIRSFVGHGFPPMCRTFHW